MALKKKMMVYRVLTIDTKGRKVETLYVSYLDAKIACAASDNAKIETVDVFGS